MMPPSAPLPPYPPYPPYAPFPPFPAYPAFPSYPSYAGSPASVITTPQATGSTSPAPSGGSGFLDEIFKLIGSLFKS
jgi:hypothetical protein